MEHVFDLLRQSRLAPSVRRALQKLEYDGVTFYFVDNEQYFGRDYIYGSGRRRGRAVSPISAARCWRRCRSWTLCPDVLHCHDWQTGLIPALLQGPVSASGALQRASRPSLPFTTCSIQGIFPIDEIEELLSLGDLGLYQRQPGILRHVLLHEGRHCVRRRDHHRQPHLRPGNPDRLLRRTAGRPAPRAAADHLCGILNGIDYRWNTIRRTIRHIERNYTIERLSEGKAAQQAGTAAELGLTEDADAPLIGMVGRLSGQKGLDLVECVLNEIMDTGAQLVVLGMGESKYVDLFSWAQWKYPGQTGRALPDERRAGAQDLRRRAICS